MKKTLLYLTAFGLVLLLALVVGYVIGSIRGARFASMEARFFHMYFACGVCDAIYNNEIDSVFPASYVVARSIYNNEVVDEPWLHEKLLIPIVEWNKTGMYPMFLFGVDDAILQLKSKAGQSLSKLDKYLEMHHSVPQKTNP